MRPCPVVDSAGQDNSIRIEDVLFRLAYGLHLSRSLPLLTRSNRSDSDNDITCGRPDNGRVHLSMGGNKSYT